MGIAVPLLAWGPHSEITQAAMDVLPGDARLRQQLGADFARLRDYCWMGDLRRSLRREEKVWFYADDYLLFPPMTKHLSHICPEVKQTYEPYFRQALLALRTQSPANAARWLGGILHFTEDTGSPPHAAEISGDLHSKMENWVDAKAVNIAGYQPQQLGKTDDEAVTGFLKRMDGLIEFSKARSEKAKPFVLSGDRASTEPIVLESALETSRVVADLLFTLGELAGSNPAGGSILSGTIVSKASPPFEKMPARVLLMGTSQATLADAEGRYEFRHLPAGDHTVMVMRPGCLSTSAHIKLSAGNTTRQDFALDVSSVPGNLVRNDTVALNWLSVDQPDAWYPVKRRLEAFWEGDLIPIQAGASYRLQVSWQEQATGQVVVQLLPADTHGKGNVLLTPLTPAEHEMSFQAAPGMVYAQVLIYGPSPGGACKQVALTPVPTP